MTSPPHPVSHGGLRPHSDRLPAVSLSRDHGTGDEREAHQRPHRQSKLGMDAAIPPTHPRPPAHPRESSMRMRLGGDRRPAHDLGVSGRALPRPLGRGGHAPEHGGHRRCGAGGRDTKGAGWGCSRERAVTCAVGPARGLHRELVDPARQAGDLHPVQRRSDGPTRRGLLRRSVTLWIQWVSLSQGERPLLRPNKVRRRGQFRCQRASVVYRSRNLLRRRR